MHLKSARAAEDGLPTSARTEDGLSLHDDEALHAPLNVRSTGPEISSLEANPRFARVRELDLTWFAAQRKSDVDGRPRSTRPIAREQKCAVSWLGECVPALRGRIATMMKFG